MDSGSRAQRQWWISEVSTQPFSWLPQSNSPASTALHGETRSCSLRWWTLPSNYLWAWTLYSWLSGAGFACLYCAGVVSTVSYIVHCLKDSFWFWWIIDRCDAHWSNLDNSDAGRRAHQHTEALFEAVGKKSLWDDYGIISDILVCRSFILS